MSGIRMPFSLKQAFGPGHPPGEKNYAAPELQQSCGDAQQRTEGGWAIRAFFRQRSGEWKSLLRPLAAMTGRPQRQRHRRPAPQQPVEQEASTAEAATSDASTSTLQTALSIQPLHGGSAVEPSGDSLDAALAAAAAAGRLQGWQSRLRRLARPLHTEAPGDSLDAILAEREKAQAHVEQQAAVLQECRDCSAAVRAQVHAAAAELAQCRAQLAADERQVAGLQAAADQEAQQAEAQIDALQHDLARLCAAANAERRQLVEAAQEALYHAAHLEAAAAEREEATAGWRQRCERMAASHKPLSQEERARHERRMHKYYANTASNVMTLLPEQH
ncbi:hypothetical protein ABPG75_004968 [Micractinium tetrahymenae]